MSTLDETLRLTARDLELAQDTRRETLQRIETMLRTDLSGHQVAVLYRGLQVDQAERLRNEAAPTENILGVIRARADDLDAYAMEGDEEAFRKTAASLIYLTLTLCGRRLYAEPNAAPKR